MSRAPSLCAVILAAGQSSRMGGDKALLPWPPASHGPAAGTFLSAAIRRLTPYNDLVIVVVGKNEADLAPVVYANGGFLVVNPEPDRGQFSSLQVGLREVLNRGRDSAMITPVDRPPVKSETVEKLVERFATSLAAGKWALIPEFEGKHGHPLLAGRELIEAFLKAPSSSAARDIEHQLKEHIDYFPVNDPFVALNVDTPEDYARLSADYVPA